MAVAIKQDQHDALLRVATYHCRDFDLSVICSDPQKLSAVQPFISEPFSSPASAPLGVLRHLPNEVLVEMCSYLDVRSTFKLRQVNRMAREIVSASPAYRDLSKHCLESLRGALRTGISSRLPVAELHRLLYTSECSRCGNHGPLLFLPLIERCCYKCLLLDGEYRLISLDALSEATKVSPSRLRELVPVLRTLTGTYFLLCGEQTERHDLVPYRAILQCSTPLDIQDLPDFVPEPEDEDMILRCTAATPFPYLDKAGSNIDHGCEMGALERSRAAPNKKEASKLGEMAYSREGYLVHFQSCEEAKKLWQESHEGTAKAVKSPAPFEYISINHSPGHYK
ncbi:unnamed protein product [Clonostachys rosea f. rosea IK726]|uniref:Uncharacterized protein n=1 Tax=Clonostachys rosea f. rosea IK726 TaxID=1349383 RepID=A0ACA9TML2_BIOOC|nr:unnamed protein product [Clonostachys rosea f. rosea IK726]